MCVDFTTLYWVGVFIAIVCLSAYHNTFEEEPEVVWVYLMMMLMSWFIVAVFIGDLIANKANTGFYFKKKVR